MTTADMLWIANDFKQQGASFYTLEPRPVKKVGPKSTANIMPLALHPDVGVIDETFFRASYPREQRRYMQLGRN
jgi:hypothetical protein